MTTLEQEKFDTVKAIADMQTSLSEGQAALLKLKETTEEYLVFREKEAEERVRKVLELSVEALAEIAKNHEELTKFGTDLHDYAEELKQIAGEIEKMFKDFGESVKEANEQMKKNSKHVENILTKIKVERVQVDEDRKQLERERKETRDGFRLLADRRAMLDRGFAELKKLTEKNI